MNYESKIKMNNKLENLSCDFMFIIICIKNSIVKNYEEFESEVCIGYVLRQNK